MQCPSCQFRNMPGVAICGRCGCNLCVDSMEIDVNPPRAANRGFWQRHFPTVALNQGNLWTRFRDFLTQTRISILGDWDIPEVDPEPIFRRIIVPGWPQIYCGNVRRGRIFLGLYLVFLFLGLLWMGSFPGNVMLGLAVGCHISSALDIALMGERHLVNRIRRSISWTALIVCFIYVPASLLLTNIFAPTIVQARMPPFLEGDVLLINQWNIPEPGDVVLYQIPPATIDVRGLRDYGGYVRIQGPRIDRILAGPGQKVEMTPDKLIVDGVPSDLRPCNTYLPLPVLNLSVPTGCYLIVPSSDPNIPVAAMPQFVSVPANQITGRVYFRNFPYSRFGFIR